MVSIHRILLVFVLIPALAFAVEGETHHDILSLDRGGENFRITTTKTDSETPELKLMQSDGSGCRVSFSLSNILLEKSGTDGSEYSSMQIAGGGISGISGETGIPTFSGMLAVPDGLKISVTAQALEKVIVPDLIIRPLQDDNSSFSSIGKSADSPRDKSLIILGDPAIYHGVRVVPFTINPILYDAQNQKLEVTSQITLDFAFSGRDDRAKPRRSGRMIPESFRGLLQGQVLNWEEIVSQSAGKSGLPATGPGTYLVISPEIASITAALQPLLDWRSRQGYTVRHATTLTTGTSTTQIKNYIQNVYDNAEIPLEYVVLVGDADGSVQLATWHESLSGYTGEGDHYYTMLDGDDILPDVLIGRLSVRDPTQLNTIVNKIIGYETNPPMDADPDWFTRAAVAGDPSESGISTVYVSQWLKAQLQDFGYTEIDTIYSGNFPMLMMGSLNQGLGAFAYRGFGGMSNFTSSHINALNNGGKLPFAVIPTCNTGSFNTYADARTEAFLRRSGGGAIGSIGMSTGGTHTRYNNCLYHGIWEGMLKSDSHTLGASHSRGKLEVYNNYFSAEPNIVEIWSVWSNLMGDPATDMWLSRPSALVVSHPTELPVGAGSVAVSVSSEGQPAAGLRVAVTKAGEVTAWAYTDETGTAVVPLSAYSAGTLLVTVTGHDYLPYRGSMTSGAVNIYADLDQIQITDDLGNDDGQPNPGETLGLRCSLRNLGSNLAGSVSAVLTSNDPYATITVASAVYGDIPAGDAVWCSGSYQLSLAADTPAGHRVALILTATDGSGNWVSTVPLNVEAASLSVVNYSWGGSGETLDPGESGSLKLTLKNSGSVGSGLISATLSTESPWVAITDPGGSFPGIDPNGESSNNTNLFSLAVAGDCYAGHLANFRLETEFAGGVTQTVQFQLTVGTVNSDDPFGPDRYGYYAIDNTDTQYPMAPVYDWIEIDPNHGGSGTSVGLTDFGWQEDDTRSLTLPFTFRYYGQVYDDIAVCSNGWLAMGSTTLKHFRNYAIPSAGSPDRMIAPFWDNLNQVGQNKVYSWYDADAHRFIVQWSRMVNKQGSEQNFQVILFDPEHYLTPSNDGNILFQYETVNNTDSVNGFATVGIQNTDGTDGLQYTYWNNNAPGAAPLAAGRAILFTARGITSGATCDVSSAEFNAVLAPDSQVTRNLTIANNGETGSILQFNITKIDAGELVTSAGADKSIAGSTMTASVSQYMPGTVMDVSFTVDCNSPDEEWIVQVSADLPAGVVVNSGTSMGTSFDPLEYNNATGDGALAVWTNGILPSGGTGTATLNLDFASTTGTVEIPYTLVGDMYGGAPHTLTGVITLTQAGPAVSLLQPNGGELWAIDDHRDIRFSSGGGVESVRIELDRGAGDGWEVLAENVSAAEGSYDWTVTGPVSTSCRMRVSDQADNSVLDTSNANFTIGRSLAWLQMDTLSAVVAEGSSRDVELSIDSSGLALGEYSIHLIVSNSAGQPVVVTVNLKVSNGPTAAPLLPAQLVLEQNHPNPFNPQTQIGFALPAPSMVRLKIYNATGRLVRTLVDGSLSEGVHSQRWDGTDDSGRRVASGVYLYRLETSGRTLSRKLIMVK